jgi:hypothetical protein
MRPPREQVECPGDLIRRTPVMPRSPGAGAGTMPGKEPFMIRKLVSLAAVLVVLLIAGVVVLVVFIDRLAKSGIEKGATFALGAQTTLGSADVGILAGALELKELQVSNPGDFSSPHFLKLGTGSTAVSLGSLRESTVVLPHLRLDGLDMHLEKKGDRSNYKVILENLKRFEAKEPDPDAKKFVIREVKLTNVTVHTNLAPIGGDLTRVDVPIEEIALKDVGSDSGGGVVLAELTNVILQAVLAAVIQKGGDLPGELLNDLKGGLASLEGLDKLGEGAVSVVGESLKGIGGVGGDALKGTAEAAEGVLKDAGDAVKGLGGLLGGDKDKKK